MLALNQTSLVHKSCPLSTTIIFNFCAPHRTLTIQLLTPLSLLKTKRNVSHYTGILCHLSISPGRLLSSFPEFLTSLVITEEVHIILYLAHLYFSLLIWSQRKSMCCSHLLSVSLQCWTFLNNMWFHLSLFIWKYSENIKNSHLYPDIPSLSVDDC